MDVMSSSLAAHDSVHKDGDTAGLTSPAKAFQECSPTPSLQAQNQPARISVSWVGVRGGGFLG